MPMQEVLRIPLRYLVNRVEQPLQVTLGSEWASQIRHDDIAHEHHSFLGEINHHGILRFAPVGRDQLDLRSADVHFRSVVDGNVRFVAQDFVGAESVTEEWFLEGARPTEVLLELVLIVASAVILGTRAQAVEIGMTADMIPVRMSDKYRRQRRQSRSVCPQRFIGPLCGVGAGPRVNTKKLMAVLGKYEVILRKFEAGQHVNTTGNDLPDDSRCKRMPHDSVFGKWCCQGDWVIEIPVTTSPQVFPGLFDITFIQRKLAKMKVNFSL